MSTPGPRPKWLHFFTPLTVREDNADKPQAMIPSQQDEEQSIRRTPVQPMTGPPQGQHADSSEDPEEESQTNDEEITGSFEVDYF